ncbi:MAG: DUF362 domain-containing protein [Candidatus Hodarchaeota archaeon]
MSISCIKVEDISDEEELISGISRAFKINKITLKKVNSIIIKPNLCYYWDASTGQTTNPVLVGALIEYLRNQLKNDPKILIGEADASAMKTKHAFKMLGYEKLAKNKEIKLLNLSSTPIEKCNTNIGSTKIELSFSKKLLETDLLINIPKLKYHRLPKITCAMKNIFGAIAKPHKFSYHKNLSKTIVAANKIIHSDIVLVDGLVALGNHPKKMKTLLLGQDAVTVDKVCTKIMGFNPNGVEYLRLADKEKMGKNNIPIVVGEASLDELRKNFPAVSYWKQRITWGLQLGMVNIYTKLVGDNIPPILTKN